MPAQTNPLPPLAALALLPAAFAASAAAQVSDSFERMLKHPASALSTPVPLAHRDDPLAAAIASALAAGTSPAEPRVPLSADPVVASFERLLRHVPSRHLPPVPQGFEPDPLIAAVAAPLQSTRTPRFVHVAAPQPH
jgi:hypothetical protein